MFFFIILAPGVNDRIIWIFVIAAILVLQYSNRLFVASSWNKKKIELILLFISITFSI